MNGFLLVDKPEGKTSFDVCWKVRKHLNTKKVGHTGTLDPFATGLLVVAVGKATKFIPYLEKASKTYEATFCLGKTTETLDTEGDVIDFNVEAEGKKLKKEEVKKVLNEYFTGKIEQVPPKFSALKINGQRAYDLARKGEEVVMKTRPAEVISCELISFEWPYVRVKIEVGAGFYVRSMARDLGYHLLKDFSEQIRELKAGGYCTQLRRTKVGDLDICDAEPLEMITMPIDPQYIFSHIEKRELPVEFVQDFMVGKAFEFPGIQGEKVLVLNGEKTIGLGEFIDGKLQPRIVM